MHFPLDHLWICQQSHPTTPARSASEEAKGSPEKQPPDGKFQEIKPVPGAAKIKLRLKCISSLLVRNRWEGLPWKPETGAPGI